MRIGDLVAKFSAKQSKGLLTFEMRLPGAVKGREYWVRVDQ